MPAQCRSFSGAILTRHRRIARFLTHLQSRNPATFPTIRAAYNPLAHPGGMPVKWWSAALSALAAFAIVTFAPVPAAAQTPATTYTPPRTREGQPDLQGIWQVLNTAAWDLQDHSASLGVP